MRKFFDNIKNELQKEQTVLRNTTVLLLLILTGNAVFVSWEVIKAVPAIDFFHYWAAAQTIRSGTMANVYSSDGMREMGDYFARQAEETGISDKQKTATRFTLQINNGSVDAVATPFLFAVISFFESGNFDRDVLVYMFFCMLCYITAVIILCRVFHFTAPVTIIMLIMVTSWFGPYNSDIRVGNINQLQLAVFALVLWLQKRSFKYHDFISGTILGLAILFKPNIGLAIALLALTWLLNRRVKKLGVLCGGIVFGMTIAYLAASFYFGTTACWTQWFRKVPDLLQSSRSIVEGNIGLSTVLYTIFKVDVSLVIVIVLVGIFTFITWQNAVKGKKGTEPAKIQSSEHLFIETAAALSLGLAFMLLSARLVWFHYYILIIPLALLQLRTVTTQEGKGATLQSSGILACIAILCLTRLPSLALPLTTITHALVINAGGVILVAVNMYELRKGIVTAGLEKKI